MIPSNVLRHPVYILKDDLVLGKLVFLFPKDTMNRFAESGRNMHPAGLNVKAWHAPLHYAYVISTAGQLLSTSSQGMCVVSGVARAFPGGRGAHPERKKMKQN